MSFLVPRTSRRSPPGAVRARRPALRTTETSCGGPGLDLDAGLGHRDVGGRPENVFPRRQVERLRRRCRPVAMRLALAVGALLGDEHVEARPCRHRRAALGEEGVGDDLAGRDDDLLVDRLARRHRHVHLGDRLAERRLHRVVAGRQVELLLAAIAWSASRCRAPDTSQRMPSSFSLASALRLPCTTACRRRARRRRPRSGRRRRSPARSPWPRRARPLPSPRRR